MTTPEVIGIVMGATSILMLLVVLYLLRRVYVVMRRDQLPGTTKDKAASRR